MAPGLYTDIGKKTRDLLYKDYNTHQKFSLTTCSPNGVAITAAGTRKNESIFGELHTQIKNKKLTVDVKANSESDVSILESEDTLFFRLMISFGFHIFQLLTTITVDEFGTPGLKSIINLVVPDQRSGKLEFQYLHEYAGVNASVGLNSNPMVNLSGAFGSKALSVGVDVSFDTATSDFTKYNAALSLTSPDLIASLHLNNHGDTLVASYYHLVKNHSGTAVGAELSHSMSRNESTLIFGSQHSLDPHTTIKTRFNNYGMASALVQHEWRPKSFVTISGDVDTKAIEKSTKVGLSLVLKH
ncbi:porin1 [Zea mays]|uniref:Porin1 n=2 Tax=Zea mays TaxID=4577 RepID=A0A1D6FYA3_MAIZE|nr:porin1 [Zea mays]